MGDEAQQRMTIIQRVRLLVGFSYLLDYYGIRVLKYIETIKLMGGINTKLINYIS